MGCFFVLTIVGAHATEKTEAAAEPHPRETATAQASRFHLLTTRCEVEASDGPETTPQSPPLEVDDPSTPGCNRWEINFVADGDLARNQNIWEFPLLDLNYGIGDNLQLKYEVPYLYSQSEGISATSIGQARAGLKIMFFEDESTKTQLGLYPQLSFINESSPAVRSGLVNPGKILTLPALVTTRVDHNSFGDVMLTGNLAYNLSSKVDTRDFISAALGLGIPITTRIAMMGELSTQQTVSRNSDSFRENSLKTSLGLVRSLSPHVLIFGSVGHSLVTSDEAPHTYVLTGFRILAGGM